MIIIEYLTESFVKLICADCEWFYVVELDQIKEKQGIMNEHVERYGEKKTNP